MQIGGVHLRFSWASLNYANSCYEHSTVQLKLQATYEFSQRTKSSTEKAQHERALAKAFEVAAAAVVVVVGFLFCFFFRQLAHGKTEQKAELETINKREFCAALISRFASGGPPT